MTDPVTIPETFENKTFRLLSNGEIELETREEEEERMKAERVFRSKRSAIPTADDIEEDYSAADRAVASAGERRPTEKSVETLVVADKALIKNHQGDERNITMYILTVMNMVRIHLVLTLMYVSLVILNKIFISKNFFI